MKDFAAWLLFQILSIGWREVWPMNMYKGEVLCSNVNTLDPRNLGVACIMASIRCWKLSYATYAKIFKTKSLHNICIKNIRKFNITMHRVEDRKHRIINHPLLLLKLSKRVLSRYQSESWGVILEDVLVIQGCMCDRLQQ